jgi:hypothetical protein
LCGCALPWTIMIFCTQMTFYMLMLADRPRQVVGVMHFGMGAGWQGEHGAGWSSCVGGVMGVMYGHSYHAVLGCKSV